MSESSVLFPVVCIGAGTLVSGLTMFGSMVLLLFLTERKPSRAERKVAP